MDFYCLVPVDQHKNVFSMPVISGDEERDPKSLFHNPNIQKPLTNMAVNHNIVKLETTGEYVGDPM